MDTLKPGWRLMWSIWHHFDQGRSACGKYRMSLMPGARKASPKHLELTADQRARWRVCPECSKAVPARDEPPPVPKDAFQVDDVISMQGPSVPKIWWTRKWRVTAVDEQGLPTVKLLPADPS